MIVVERTPWRLQYTQGARIADVYHVEFSTPVANVEVGDYDWSTSEQRAPLDEAQLLAELDEWIAENADDHVRNLPHR